jgi:hypothetical protein
LLCFAHGRPKETHSGRVADEWTSRVMVIV